MELPTPRKRIRSIPSARAIRPISTSAYVRRSSLHAQPRHLSFQRAAIARREFLSWRGAAARPDEVEMVNDVRRGAAMVAMVAMVVMVAMVGIPTIPDILTKCVREVEPH
mmetsp:Transcript_57588/g.95217  ORF Transcript_57588/g.95217 Transcript_57588/m.95217 type:complete len:110 (+) Transcript_57588:706-1035(+)